MKNRTNIVAWFVFVFLAIGVGLYPILYFIADGKVALLASKGDELLANISWQIGFYGHISLGGLALMIGWIQFSKKMRSRNLKMHRNIGKLYVIAAVISGICGFYIAFNATGGLVTTLGFLCLAIVWLLTTLKAYFAIRKGDVQLHQGFMIYSYAACFAAVTLRIWLPLLTIVFDGFIPAYRVVAWLCWVPNMIFAYFWVRRKGLIIG